MVGMRHPLIDLDMNDETARYVGALERKLLRFTLDNLKLRTVLELLTDQSWDDEAYPDEAQELRRIAQDALVRRLGMSANDAAAVVAERWAKYNPEEGTEATKTYLIGPAAVKRPVVAPQSRQVSPGQSVPGVNMQKHLDGLAKANENRQKS